MRCYSVVLMGIVLATAAFGGELNIFAQGDRHVKSSMLLLIDVSGSMGDAIGSGNSQVKIEAAKQAAIAALGRAAHSGSVEVAVLAFSGDCQNPVPRYQDFTRDVSRLTQFINSVQPGGGTPMAEALLFANRYMHVKGNPSAATRMIMLLADGQNDCGDVGQAMAALQSSGIIFRHETVGFGITPSSAAAQDLRQIATQTGGVYHHASDANQLADVFMEFVDTFSVIDLLGMFGKSSRPTGGAVGPATGPSTGPRNQQSPKTRGLTAMIGGFKAARPTQNPLTLAEAAVGGQFPVESSGGGSPSASTGGGGAVGEALRKMESSCGERYRSGFSDQDHGRFFCLDAFARYCALKKGPNQQQLDALKHDFDVLRSQGLESRCPYFGVFGGTYDGNQTVLESPLSGTAKKPASPVVEKKHRPICADGDTVPIAVAEGRMHGCSPDRWCLWDACRNEECRLRYPECQPGVLQ